MKIDAVLARHPWPWVTKRGAYMLDDEWSVVDANGEKVFDDGSAGEGIGAQVDDDVRDAFLELVEAHVARTTRVATHSEECWRWHLDCAVRKVEGMKAKEGKQ